MVLVDPQCGHLCGLPLGMVFTSCAAFGRGFLLICCWGIRNPFEKLQQPGLLKTRGFICFSVLLKNVRFKKAEHDVGAGKNDEHR